MSNPKSIVPVVLCGGGGTRLWPRSRKTKPKPFLPLLGDSTIFEATLARFDDWENVAAPLVVTGQPYLEYVEAQLADADSATVIVEPRALNTAPAIALAAMRLPEDAIMLVCPSDHHIGNLQAFREAAEKAADLADAGWLVSFGIEATAPDTGFGYLELGEPVMDIGHKTARFVEKPDAATAMKFLSSGNFAWNGGIFAFRAGTFLAELQAHRPSMASAVRRSVAEGSSHGRRFFPHAEAFSGIEGESVDYAIMENTDRAALVKADMGWSDIGSWDKLHAVLETDLEGNSVRGNVDLVECKNVLADTDGARISAIGLNDLVIIVDGKDVLVTTHAGAQGVGKLPGASNQ